MNKYVQYWIDFKDPPDFRFSYICTCTHHVVNSKLILEVDIADCGMFLSIQTILWK